MYAKIFFLSVDGFYYFSDIKEAAIHAVKPNSVQLRLLNIRDK